MAIRKPLVIANGIVSELSGSDSLPLTWTTLATTWDSPPTKVGTVASGDVYSYVHKGTTYYRLVPSSYTAASDAFYSTFSGGVLSNLVVSRA